MVSKDDMFQEFELIQTVIERQVDHSFVIKGWTVSLVVVALIFRTDNFQLIAAFLPVIGFWRLEAYYRRQTKMYRELYDWVRKNRLDNDVHWFDLDTN